MSALHNYTISFKSLRTGTLYTVTIGGGTGEPIPLKGGAQPFVTQEDGNEDMFVPIRTQTGYVRIVDDDKDANGSSLGTDWWKDIIPETDTSRPVALTHVENNATVVDWQGFMQAQTFSGVLYGNPQEREFPVQCCLSVLNGIQTKTNVTTYKNFAYVLDYIFDSIPTHTISQIVIQGGADAREWLRKKTDWRNFVSISEGDITPSYSLFGILQDICRYWGWTARTYRQQIILTSADNITAEPNALQLTTTQLHNIGMEQAGSIGSVVTMYSAASIGNSFSSTEQSDTMLRGYSKVVVKSDCNKSDSEMAFAPQTIRDKMEEGGYTWHANPDDSYIGYFTTPEIGSFDVVDSSIMEGGSSSYGGFSRRQIYHDSSSAEPDIVDCIDIRNPYNGNVKAWLESVYEMSFPGGSFGMSATFYQEWDKCNFGAEFKRSMKMAIGIGKTRYGADTMWLNVDHVGQNMMLTWSTTKQVFDVMVRYMPTLCPCQYISLSGTTVAISTSRVPVPAGVSGRVFVEFYGSPDDDYYRIGHEGECNFQIADFTITFSRDSVSIADGRERQAIRKRYSTREYKVNTNAQASDTKNVDLLFASDNDMDYGYGLLMNANGSFMSTAQFGSMTTQPEQYLANRIAAFYGQPRRLLALTLDNEPLSPLDTATVNNTSCYPIAISNDWREDVVRVSFIQI